MFKLADPKEIYTYPVTVNVPAGAGKTAPQTFTAHFRLLPADKLLEVEVQRDDVVFLEAVLADWEDIKSHDGKPLPCNPATRRKLAGVGYFATAVGRAYGQFAMGLPAKNLKTPLDS